MGEISESMRKYREAHDRELDEIAKRFGKRFKVYLDTLSKQAEDAGITLEEHLDRLNKK